MFHYRTFRQTVASILIGSWCAIAAAQPAITIEGAPEDLTRNIRGHLSLSAEDCAAPPWRLQALLQESDREIREAGQALGYYKLQMEKEFIPGGDCWQLRLKIDPGQPVMVGKIDIDITGGGRDDPAFDALPSEIVIHRGDRLDHGKYEAIKKHLAALARTRGYFDAEFARSVIMVDIDNNSATIEIRYDTGPRYRFGAVSIDQSILSEELINRYITFIPGDAYDSSKLLDLQQALNEHYFSQVHARPLPEEADNGSVPIRIEMIPLKQHSLSLGAGVATDTGPRFRFDYENRYLNPAGHRLNTGLSLSSMRSEIHAGYIIPLHSPQRENLRFFTGYVDEETDTSSSIISSLGTHYSLVNESEWLQTWSLNFQHETFIVSAESDRSTNLLIPGLSLAKTRSSETVYPLYGWRLNASIQGASASALSDLSFSQLHGNAKYIHAAGRGRILLRMEGGVTNVSEFDELPASLRFFAGGDTSVRGYEYRSLGPTDADGNVIGGRRLLLAGIEYDRRILPQWAVAAFYDAGNAFNTRDDYASKRGAGLGLRWLSPIGPIRLDIAKALDDAEEWRVHIGMGPDL